MLLDKGYGIAYLLRGVFLHILICVAQRRGKLEHGDAILKLHALGYDTVAEERAVAGRVALNGAAADNGRVVVDGNARLRLRHGAYVARKPILLGNIDIMYRRALIEKHWDICGGYLAAEWNNGRKAHHDRLHFVLVYKHDLL